MEQLHETFKGAYGVYGMTFSAWAIADPQEAIDYEYGLGARGVELVWTVTASKAAEDGSCCLCLRAQQASGVRVAGSLLKHLSEQAVRLIGLQAIYGGYPRMR